MQLQKLLLILVMIILPTEGFAEDNALIGKWKLVSIESEGEEPLDLTTEEAKSLGVMILEFLDDGTLRFIMIPAGKDKPEVLGTTTYKFDGEILSYTEMGTKDPIKSYVEIEGDRLELTPVEKKGTTFIAVRIK